MADRGQETEAKFYVLRLDKIIDHLQRLDASLIQPRLLETNLRFDRPDASLHSRGQVLRLRYDTQARLTYKGAGQNKGGVLDRVEIEFTVEDGEKAHQFLEALGYQKSAYYEKYRATYELDHVQIMLDELPYGNFVEVEGETVEQIRAVTEMLGLRWDAAIPSSYTGLFEELQRRLQLSFEDISFENFSGIQVKAADLSVRPADE